MMAKHGARYLTKGSTHKLPEGGHWKPERVVIIEFPDMDALNTWYNSPEYEPHSSASQIMHQRSRHAVYA
jgi:uncharacterized protein (DUF1330 family)